MMISTMTRFRPAARQRGITLVITLMFMVALTLLGVGMIKATTSEERMGANSRDYDLAFAAAEAGLRDAEVRIQGVNNNPATPLSFTAFGNSGALNSCSSTGLCLGITTQPIYSNSSFPMDSSPSAVLNAQSPATPTGTPNIQGVTTQPRYYIELLQIPNVGGTGTLLAYRITSKGYGRNTSTNVLLQEVVIY